MAFPSASLGAADRQTALSRWTCQIEANRCLNCYDAPCTRACPTAIDVPRFIGRIATGDLLGSARTIMDANPVGASCARVCPTDQLCEGACVYNADDNPIRIGDLQRYATDWAIRDRRHAVRGRVRRPANASRWSAAVRRVSRRRASSRAAGHAVTIFERDAASRRARHLRHRSVPAAGRDRAVGSRQVRALGVEIRTGVTVGETSPRRRCSAEYDAVMLAVGMGAVPRLGIEGEDAAGVWDALDFIRVAKMRRRRRARSATRSR